MYYIWISNSSVINFGVGYKWCRDLTIFPKVLLVTYLCISSVMVSTIEHTMNKSKPNILTMLPKCPVLLGKESPVLIRYYDGRWGLNGDKPVQKILYRVDIQPVCT